MTDTPTTPEGDMSFAMKFPGECTEGVDRRGEFQPCDRPAVAVRIDPGEGGTYPVCAFHARAPMASLKAVFNAGRSQALEEAARIAETEESPFHAVPDTEVFWHGREYIARSIRAAAIRDGNTNR